jgi:3-methyladenine DNA glycosylase AlkD
MTGSAPSSIEVQVQEALAWLEAHASAAYRDALGPRYGIHTTKALGVSVANIQVLGKQLGRSHDLASALWATGGYEARLLAAFVDEPVLVTPEQMDRWCRDFDNWGVCDTVCFHLFDRTPHAWAKVHEWSAEPEEFVRRAAFALLACLALHDKKASSEAFAPYLPLLERGASDERNFVKKAVVWALRGIGGRKPELRGEVVALARRLASSSHATERWVGKTVLREMKVSS